jgi:gas vesicle protein
MSRNTNTLVAFLVGAAVGSVTALLLAPEKGEVTRRRLRDGSSRAIKQGKDAVTRAAASVQETAREKGHEVSEVARQQVSAVRGAVAEAKDAYRRELEKG